MIYFGDCRGKQFRPVITQGLTQTAVWCKQWVSGIKGVTFKLRKPMGGYTILRKTVRVGKLDYSCSWLFKFLGTFCRIWHIYLLTYTKRFEYCAECESIGDNAFQKLPNFGRCMKIHYNWNCSFSIAYNECEGKTYAYRFLVIVTAILRRICVFDVAGISTQSSLKRLTTGQVKDVSSVQFAFFP